MTQGHKCVTVNNHSGCEFDPHSKKLNIYLNLYFMLCSGVEANRGVEFRHSIDNASRIWRKVGSGVSQI